ncbi:hypothetical protein HMPREF0673_00659 [Leyella stercorea DSM 18206]|uniref:Uncharacterized protein n=1 Tax=Leyella stercorea DSM 18206 TaxID=1002367 RepID=G6AVM4_9BACT|nr:hypothetical protein HMPREF0673_00659 [Leyella stercorea DSM 18206]
MFNFIFCLFNDYISFNVTTLLYILYMRFLSRTKIQRFIQKTT